MTTHAQIIDLALDRIVTGYVFPQRAVEVDQAIRARLASGAYDALSGAAFCAAVTAHLQEVCPDKHLRLLWQDEPRATESAGEDAGRAAFLALMRAENQGIRRCEQLDGNIGYLDVRWMADAGEGARAIGAAMELVAHSRALLLDLRECRGGSPAGAAMWCSYFFPDDQVHLNDFYERATDSTRQYWTLSHLPAPRYLYRPVYVLTSATTFSGGEDVAYTLQAYERAEVIGETTRGGAHPTDRYPVTEHITVTVPTARTTNAVTGTNWEGVGVRPDHDVPADTAFEVAYKEALERRA
ncbi:S41 family peptidase [Streptomyces sioyaensis]|uniref:Peptidase S41 n=1 Tax=Streptomyces sioyaensis TaxID=67364 RepID=A0A4Q1QZC0_9ACTN|nr:S41 family peptidase [Streptomyces sioyaensis]MBM4792150.1 S41 family peptidase [Streptomyces sioyaensis]RXS65394.1 peptidase S41 [Streptomyces sioyaensis]